MMRSRRPEQQHILIIQKIAAPNENMVATQVAEIHDLPTVASTPNESNALLKAPLIAYDSDVTQMEAASRNTKAAWDVR